MHTLDDDRLATLLGAVLDHADPVPLRVTRRAHALATDAATAPDALDIPELTTDLDLELALLTFDSDLQPAGLRSAGASSRELQFETGGHELVLLVTGSPGALRIDGQLIPAEGSGIELAGAVPGEHWHAVVDDTGRFRFSSVGARRARIVVPGARFRTPEFDLGPA
ncbi:hypothetical protein GIS00_09935 [Nakamurella sp. YIM 132087]|uniref:Uncharacterized protein n=1 Tax=Nakamurella alba TaxID=2665158 RepID=A0A7K1FJL3_9ACTN|nr:hypothetical protein [Nakamurella alba]MTD14266.1 hypothetical protein [Nakamurella alba]